MEPNTREIGKKINRKDMEWKLGNTNAFKMYIDINLIGLTVLNMKDNTSMERKKVLYYLNLLN